jgi:HTH-type transcriptional regulator / antitoxin HigA
MELKPIRTEGDYHTALAEVAPFFDKEPPEGSPEADRFEVLLLLIENYEQKRYPIAPPDPVEAIKFRMEQAGLTPKDLEPMIGQMNRVYEVLARRRPLTLRMIRRLHQGLGIPAESLIAEPAPLRFTLPEIHAE